MFHIFMAVIIGYVVYGVLQVITFSISRGIAKSRFGPGEMQLLKIIEKEGNDSPRLKYLRVWDNNRDEIIPIVSVLAGVVYFLNNISF